MLSFSLSDAARVRAKMRTYQLTYNRRTRASGNLFLDEAKSDPRLRQSFSL